MSYINPVGGGSSFTSQSGSDLPRLRLENRVRRLLWSYLWLLVFEGAIRKWIPGFSAAFLLVRDPIAVAILWYGAQLGIGSRIAWSAFTCYAALISVLGLLQIISGDNTFIVFLYGWRSYVLHLPVILVASQLWRGPELFKVLRWFLAVSIPMAILMCLQYAAPPSSALNAGTISGLTSSGQIEGALGHIRPPGTFSFTTGPAAFYPVVAAICIFGLFFYRTEFSLPLLIFSSLSVLMVIPISISRTLAVTIGLVILCGLIAAVVRGAIDLNKTLLPRLISGCAVALAAVLILAQLPIMKDSIETFTTRWTNAAEGQDATTTLTSRVLIDFTAPLENASNVPILGGGIGAGSTVAAFLRGDNLAYFTFGEGAVQREFSELGLIFGTLFICFRAISAVLYAVTSIKDMRRGTVLSWLLLVPACTSIFIAPLDQATAQGFLVVTVSLALASLPSDSTQQSMAAPLQSI